jgi:hypothetical protein
MDITDKSIEIFCLVDDFTNEFEKVIAEHRLSVYTSRKTRKRQYKMSDSEVITILILSFISTEVLNTFISTMYRNTCRQSFLIPFLIIDS